MEKKLLSTAAAAQYLGITKGTLYVWVCKRRVPFVKVGRLTKFDIEDLERWIEDRKMNKLDLDFKRGI